MYLGPVRLGEAFVGQDVLLGAAHQVCELGVARFEREKQLVTVLPRCGECVLFEVGSERRGDDRSVLLIDESQRFAHEMHGWLAKVLDDRAQHLGG